MGFWEALRGNADDDVTKVIRSCDASCEGVSEVKIRDRLEARLAKSLLVSPKREGGVAGVGTRVDLYFQYRNVDYLLSLKKGLSEQKVKTLLGEAVILATEWTPKKPATRAVLVVVLCLDEYTSQINAYFDALSTGLGFIQKHAGDRFSVTFDVLGLHSEKSAATKK
jgi:hypothetical protein